MWLSLSHPSDHQSMCTYIRLSVRWCICWNLRASFRPSVNVVPFCGCRRFNIYFCNENKLFLKFLTTLLHYRTIKLLTIFTILNEIVIFQSIANSKNSKYSPKMLFTIGLLAKLNHSLSNQLLFPYEKNCFVWQMMILSEKQAKKSLMFRRTNNYFEGQC